MDKTLQPHKRLSQPGSHPYWKNKLYSFRLVCKFLINSEQREAWCFHASLPKRCVVPGFYFLWAGARVQGPRRPKGWILGSDPSTAGGDTKGKKPAVRSYISCQVTWFPPETCAFLVMVLLHELKNGFTSFPLSQAQPRAGPSSSLRSLGLLRHIGSYPSPAQSTDARIVTPCDAVRGRLVGTQGEWAVLHKGLHFSSKAATSRPPPNAPRSFLPPSFLTSLYHHLQLSSFFLTQCVPGLADVP